MTKRPGAWQEPPTGAPRLGGRPDAHLRPRAPPGSDMVVGEVDGWEIQHTCRNPRCIERSHLVPVTAGDHDRAHETGRLLATSAATSGQTASMSVCPQCQRSVQVQDRLHAIEDGGGDLDGAALYQCGLCSMMYVLAADGSTAPAEFE